jgi:glutaredoxin-related protein
MEIQLPNKTNFTIYTKSNCIYCDKVKLLFDSKNKNYEIINCDKFLENEINKQEFLEFIKNLTNKEWKTFPIVFHEGEFVGGFNETNIFLEKMDAFDNVFV